ncbi:hypothetical protein MHU86_25932 [Fragilaria crotonensis]|nr:hypothetical protein MHU86_25932 [Fragilaria crotonensis]
MECGVVVTQHRAGHQPGVYGNLCPGKAKPIIDRLRTGKRTLSPSGPQFLDIPINAVMLASKGVAVISRVSSNQVLQQLRDAALQYGTDCLGFSVDKMGTHSLIAGTALAMHLAGVPTATIQLIDRWRSQDFLRYLRTQVPHMTRGVSTNTTSTPNFFTVLGNPTKDNLQDESTI